MIDKEEMYFSIKQDGWDTYHKGGISNPYVWGTDKWLAWDTGQHIARNGGIRPTEHPIKPSLSCASITYEFDTYKKCDYCGSSLKRVLLFFKSKYCIQPKCKNYYKLNES